MCGIFLTVTNNQSCYDEFEKIKHRGPDGSQFLVKKYANSKLRKSIHYGFHRLSIMNPESGINQPFQVNDVIVLCNGEIYNWESLKLLIDMPNIKSDCEIIPNLYLYCERDFLKMISFLDGEFAIILHDLKNNTIYAARDFMGIRPLYWNLDVSCNELQLASELKAIKGKGMHIRPRIIYSFNSDLNKANVQSYWNFQIPIQSVLNDGELNNFVVINKIIDRIYDILFTSVRMRMNANRPLGCLLSGGLDSSIIASLAVKVNPNIRFFVIGTENSPDVIAAKKVAEFLSAKLTVIPFNMDDGVNAIEDVIESLETYDVTTVRASIPQYFLAKWISENTDIKVVLSGEGSDELFGGYIYSKLAPTANDLYEDRKRLLNELYMFDCLRTDRTMAAFGLEVRVPFLQKKLVDFVTTLNPKLFMSDKFLEKILLRLMAIQNKLLPNEIAMRGKEAFSDAVDFSWKNKIMSDCKYRFAKRTDSEHFCLTDKEKQEYSSRGSIAPFSYEALLYRNKFDKYYKNKKYVLEHYWMPKWTNVNDPSATVLSVYKKN